MSKKTFVKNPQKKKGEGELTYEVRYAKADLRTGYQVEAVGNLITAINEARADFPIDDDLIDDDHIFSPREELLRYHKLEHKRAVWFNKWFGETKQQ